MDVTGSPVYDENTPEKPPSHGLSVDTTLDVENANKQAVANVASPSKQTKFDKNSNAVCFHSTLNLS